MTVRTIKEIHHRLLAKFGELNLSTEEIDDDLACSNGKSSTIERLPITQHPIPLVKSAMDRSGSDVNNPPKIYGKNTATQIITDGPAIRCQRIKRHLYN